MLQALKRRLERALSQRSRPLGSGLEDEFLDRDGVRRARLVSRRRDVAGDWNRSGRVGRIGEATVVEAEEGEGLYRRAAVCGCHCCGGGGGAETEGVVGSGVGG